MFHVVFLDIAAIVCRKGETEF